MQMPHFDAARLVRLHRVTSVSASPDGAALAVCVQRLDDNDAGWVGDLWKLSASDAAVAPVPLTHGKANDTAPAWRGDGSLLFLSNRPTGKKGEGEPVNQVWCLPAAGGEPVVLTDEPLGVSAFRVAGDTLAIVTQVLEGVALEKQRETAADRKKNGPSTLHYRRMPVRFWDHWLSEAVPHFVVFDTAGRRDLTPAAGRAFEQCSWDLAPDGAAIFASHARRGVDRVDDRTLVRIGMDGSLSVMEAQEKFGVGVVAAGPDGRVAVIGEDRDRTGAPTLLVRLYEAGGSRDFTEQWPSELVWSGDALYACVSEGGHVPVVRIDVASGERTRLTGAGTHQGLVAISGGVAGLEHRISHPPEAWAWRDGKHGVLAGLSGFDPTEALVTVEEVRVPGAGGTLVHSFVVAPIGEGSKPLLLWIHGGPISAYTDGWHWRWNPLVAASAGFVVALPNPRGSTGYGQAFVDGIWGNTWGGDCYTDLMAVTDALCTRADVDPARTAAMGGSFGGYMTNWIGASTERFRALVTHAGVFQLSAFHGVTDEPGWLALQQDGAPWQDLQRYDQYSPHRGIGRWRTPTLVVHGEMDYRVPIAEALSLFEHLDAHGVDAELLVFPDENHWILKPRNIEVWYRETLGFLHRHL